MLAHRFKEQLRLLQRTPVETGSTDAFVPCPMMQLFPVTQQTQVQESYRLAAELTVSQLQPAPVFMERFSLN